MLWIGNGVSIDPRGDMRSILTPQLGSEDLKFIQKGQEEYIAELEYNLQTSTFAKYGIQAAGGGVGTIDKSLSLLLSAKLGGVAGTENYIQILGSRINSLTLAGRVGELTRARLQIWAKQNPDPSATSPVGTGSFATDPASAPWTFYDGGANPVTIGALTPDVKEINVTFDRNLERVPILGDSKQKFLVSKHRRISGTLTILWQAITAYNKMTTDNENTITWVLKTAVSTLTLTGCKLTRLEQHRFEPTELVLERYSFTAKTASIT